MKKMRYSLTIWFALAIPVFGWFSIWVNNGIMPIFLQWNGPLLITIGIILLRLRTSDAICSQLGRKHQVSDQDVHDAYRDDICGTSSLQ